MGDQPIVRLENVGKAYGPVVSLQDITLEIGSNEIVGLIGDNGAGKSTLIKIVTGVETPTTGEVYIRGEHINFSNYSVQRAHELRIETVHQTSSLGTKQPLWRNFFVGRPITNALGFIKVREQKRISEQIMRETIGFRGAGIDVDTPVGRLSGGERQGVAIGRAMHFESDLIVLDEPTVALALSEVEKVLNFIRSIKENGRSCIYIEHNIHHVHEVCDRLIVLDRGRLVLDCEAKAMSYTELTDFLRNLHQGHEGETKVAS
ncbi:MAG: ATP-binding cassette domain-containing protein [Alphaproteobacteria bacterium]|nr:ATP-binding cassette domain-containing protein [Alphaproteobacteria bacterium]